MDGMPRATTKRKPNFKPLPRRFRISWVGRAQWKQAQTFKMLAFMVKSDCLTRA